MNPFYVKWPLFVEKYICLEWFLTKWLCNNCVSSKIKIYFSPLNCYILFLNELHSFTIITVFTTVHNYVLWQDIVWSFQRVKMPNKISSACIIVQCMYCLCNMITKFWLTIQLFYFHIQPRVIRQKFHFIEKRNKYFFEAHMYLVRFSVCFKKLSQTKMLTIINNFGHIKTRGVKGN